MFVICHCIRSIWLPFQYCCSLRKYTETWPSINHKIISSLTDYGHLWLCLFINTFYFTIFYCNFSISVYIIIYCHTTNKLEYKHICFNILLWRSCFHIFCFYFRTFFCLGHFRINSLSTPFSLDFVLKKHVKVKFFIRLKVELPPPTKWQKINWSGMAFNI